MTDIVDPLTRSQMMSRIRNRDTRPEILIRRLLHSLGFRFRLCAKDIPGKPDIVLPKYRAVLFVHGCFWHGHSCVLYRTPKTRQEFWKSKIARNRKNDTRVLELLKEDGWRIGLIWECAIRLPNSDHDKVVRKIHQWLVSGKPWLEIKG